VAVAAGAALRVTCIMPPRDRRTFVPGAIRCFLRQDHAAREPLILDDGAGSMRDLVPDPRIRYVHLDGPRSRSRTSTLLRRISASRSPSTHSAGTAGATCAR